MRYMKAITKIFRRTHEKAVNMVKRKLNVPKRQDSTQADAAPEPVTCSEYFHSWDSLTEEIRVCVGKYHTKPHHVCRTCIETAASWKYKPSRGYPVDDTPLALHQEYYTPLCLPCTATVVQHLGPTHPGCICKRDWYCFECRDVISWRGDNQLKDIEIREKALRKSMQWAHGLASENFEICAGCEAVMEVREPEKHAHVCMACKGIRLDGGEEDSLTGLEEQVKAAPCAPLKSPNWMAKSTQKADPDEIEDLGPNEVSKPSSPDQYTSTSSMRYELEQIEEWEFPRSPEQRTRASRPSKGNAITDEKVQRILKDYVLMDKRSCWSCGKQNHWTGYCDVEWHEFQGLRKKIDEWVDAGGLDD